MPLVSRLFFRTAILFLIGGIGIGLHMAMSQDHTAATAHAHINLLGWVTMAIFGVYYALNPVKAARRLALVQYGVYTLGVLMMAPSLYLLMEGHTALEPLVGIASMITFAGVILFGVVVFTGDGKEREGVGRPLFASRPA